MARTYYQIELTARQLTVLLVVLAGLLVLAFALGYGAAWSVLGGSGDGGPGGPGSQAAAPVAEARLSPTPETALSEATPIVLGEPTPPPPPVRTATPPPPTAAPVPTAPPTPPPTAVPTRVPTAVPQGAAYWVQVLAVEHRSTVDEAREKLEALQFPPSHQRLIQERTRRGNVLYKLRVGPFPDRDSAERVMRRMRAAGFPDAWMVTP